MTLQDSLDRFCESPKRWLIVTAVTFVIGLVTVLPQVDLYYAERTEKEELSEELREAERTYAELPQLRQRVEAKRVEIEGIEDRGVDEQRLTPFRDSLVLLTREAGCQMRRINVGSPRKRDWRRNDQPLGETNTREPVTPFVLETRPVTLSVTGPIEAVRKLLSLVEEDDRFLHSHSLALRPLGRNADVQLDVEVWYFALTNRKA